MPLRFTSRAQIIEHISRQFEQQIGRVPDLHNPQTFNEKLQWLKLNYRERLMTRCSDKYGVRDYVASHGYSNLLTPLYACWETANAVDFSHLPDQFVLKTTNGSGTNIVCEDKLLLDQAVTRAQIEQWLQPSASHYFVGYEWGYKNIKPRVIAETYLADVGTLRDYKFFCFHGEPKFIYVSTEYGSKDHIDMNFMTIDWERLPYERRTYKPHSGPLEPPEHLHEMVEIARTLAAPFPFVRVDLYDRPQGPLFSELTFYPANGVGAFTRDEHDLEIGQMLTLPKKRRPARPFELVRR